MLSEFNSLLFYVFGFGAASWMLNFVADYDKKKTFFYYLMVAAAFGIPTIMAGYRTCGTDTMVYAYNYVFTFAVSWAELWESIEGIGEAGHKIFSWVLRHLSHTRYYFAIYAFVTVGFAYKAVKYVKKEKMALCMFLFFLTFFVYSFNTMRQYMAIAIVMLSFKYIFEKKFVKYLLCVLLATTFHTSAILTVFLYFLWVKDGKLVSWFFLVPLLAAIVAVGINLESVLQYVSGLELESEAINRYATYTEMEEAKNREFYLNLLVAFVALLHYTRLKKLDEKNTFWIFLVLVGTCLGVCGFVSPYAKRIMLYFSVAEIFVLSEIPKCYEDHHSIWTARILVGAYAVSRFTIIAYVLGHSGLIPYIWYLPYWAQI